MLKKVKKCYFGGSRWCHRSKMVENLGKIFFQNILLSIMNKFYCGFLEWCSCYSWVKGRNLQKVAQNVQKVLFWGSRWRYRAKMLKNVPIVYKQGLISRKKILIIENDVKDWFLALKYQKNASFNLKIISSKHISITSYCTLRGCIPFFRDIWKKVSSIN